MRFSKQPNGQWCGYSTVSDSFYESNLSEADLLAEVIRDEAYRIARRYIELLSDGGYSFDDIIEEFKYSNDDKKTRAFWERKFRYMGCSKEQMEKVKARIDYLEVEGELGK